MNALEFTAWLLSVIVSCSAQPVAEQAIDGATFQVQSWVCQTTKDPILVKAWRRPCQGPKDAYWGRMVFLEFQDVHTALYINRFGEVMIGQGAQIGDAYLPSCGS